MHIDIDHCAQIVQIEAEFWEQVKPAVTGLSSLFKCVGISTPFDIPLGELDGLATIVLSPIGFLAGLVVMCYEIRPTQWLDSQTQQLKISHPKSTIHKK